MLKKMNLCVGVVVDVSHSKIDLFLLIPRLKNIYKFPLFRQKKGLIKFLWHQLGTVPKKVIKCYKRIYNNAIDCLYS